MDVSSLKQKYDFGCVQRTPGGETGGHLVAEEGRAEANGEFGHMNALQASGCKVAALMDGDDACQYSQCRGY